MRFKITLLLFLFFAIFSYSQSQFINQNFGDNGLACIDAPGATRQMRDLIKINDAYYGLTGFTDFNLVKLSSAGDIITSFGTNGFIPLNIGAGEAGFGHREAFLKSTPNNLLMVSNFIGQAEHNFITQTDLEGNAITSFGNNGYIATWGTDNITIHYTEIINNEIVLVGNGSSSNPTDPHSYIIVMKYDLNGNPVSSFGNNGIMTMDLDDGTSSRKAYYFPDSGHVLILANVPNTVQTYLGKYDIANGTMDTTFGTNGYIHFPFNEDVHIFTDTFLVENNTIYLAGSIDFEGGSGDYKVYIKKMGMNGQPDINFGTEGTFLYDITEIDYQIVNSINKNSEIITLTGSFYANDIVGEKIYVLQTNASGLLNTAFGDNGVIITPFVLAESTSTFKTLVENDNLITVATTSSACATDTENKPAVIQFTGTALSTASISNKRATEYYPNPVLDILSINSNQEINKAEVYDATGKLVLALNSLKFNKLDLSVLESGFYIVKVYQEGKSDTIRIIKE